MQGIESLDNFKKFVSSLGGLGRYEDTYIVHAAEGETVVPMEVLDKNPALKKRLFKTMMDMGIEPGRYIVGNELNSKNPVTGQPEFFLKKIVSQIRKAIPGDLEQFLGPAVGIATGNPFLGALAGAVGSGTQGALAGGLGGFQSPGIGAVGRFGRTSVPFGDIFKSKVGPIGLEELFSRPGASKFFFGDKDKKGLFGKFDFTKDVGEETAEKTYLETLSDLKDKFPDTPIEDLRIEAKDQLERAAEAAKSVKAGALSVADAAKLFGLGTTGLGLLIKLTDEQQDVGLERDMTQGNVLTNLLDAQPLFAEEGGGVTDLRQGGESVGPGTGTSDDIPAMLSDGEFVMTAKAVRGAGGGDRREGAKKMYEAMDKLEAQA
jgi:hypothetical protein